MLLVSGGRGDLSREEQGHVLGGGVLSRLEQVRRRAVRVPRESGQGSLHPGPSGGGGEELGSLAEAGVCSHTGTALP